MHFSTVALFLPLTVLANPLLLLPRATDNAAAILKNLTQTYNDAVAENTTLNGFGDDSEPTFFQALALQSGGAAIASDINSTTLESNKSSAFTSAESTQIYNELKNTLLPATQQLLANFIAHYPGLNEQGLSSTIETSLVQQRDLTEILGTSLMKKSTGPSKKKGPALTKQFVAAFNAAITKYSS